MSACQYGSPIVLSWPHFYDSDEMEDTVEVYEITNLEEILVNNNNDFSKISENDLKLNLLKADQEKHQFFLDIQPRLVMDRFKPCSVFRF